MAQSVSLPTYSDTLADFLGDLRSWVFRSQSKAAKEFGLSHVTVSRYENGHFKPPVGYVAHLAKLIIEKLEREGKEVDEQREWLRKQVNKAIRLDYPGQMPFQEWDQLCAAADAYKAPPQKSGDVVELPPVKIEGQNPCLTLQGG